MESLLQLINAITPYLTLKNLGGVIVVLDIICGALPDKYTTWPGITLKIAKALHDYGKKEKKLLILLLCATMFSCSFIQVKSDTQDLVAFNIGLEISENYPDLKEKALYLCNLGIDLDDTEKFDANAKKLIEYLVSNADLKIRQKANIERLLKNITITMDTDTFDLDTAKAALSSLRDGLLYDETHGA